MWREREFFTGKCSAECPVELSRVDIHIPMQNYKSLRVAVTIWTTKVNTQTSHRQIDK